jgi:hypothetical protein
MSLKEFGPGIFGACKPLFKRSQNHWHVLYIHRGIPSLTNSQHPSVLEIGSGTHVSTIVPIMEDKDEFGIAIR